MKKRDLALSALVLSQALTQVTSPAFAYSRFDLGGMKLSSSALGIGDKNYFLKLQFQEPNITDETSELIGIVELVAEDGSLVGIPGFADGDGNMLFQRVMDPNGQTKYVGSFCNSSFKDCEEPNQSEKFELTRTEGSWRASITTNFTSSIDTDDEVMLNVEEILLSDKP